MTTNTPAPKASKARVNRTPQEKAQDRLDAATARLGRARNAEKRLQDLALEADKAFRKANAETIAAEAAVEFESRNPDLPIAKSALNPAVGGAS